MQGRAGLKEDFSKRLAFAEPCAAGIGLFVPRLRLGTRAFRALHGQGIGVSMTIEADPPGNAFPGRAWE